MAAVARPLLVVDAANVVGAVPDGWWRDRLGAARRLRDRLPSVAESGLPQAAGVLAGPLDVVLVVEGVARALAAEDAAGVGAAAEDAAGVGAAAEDAAGVGAAGEDAAGVGAAGEDAAGVGAAGGTTVRVVGAPRSGDDAIVALVRAAPAGRVVAVVTADRALRDRVSALGALVVGPRALVERSRRPR